MNWVGNDIVDLSLADSNSWKRERYRIKLFSSSEQDIILNAPNPFRMLWLLWSMKESAYKIHYRHTRKRSFNPLRFACELTEEGRGRVEVDKRAYLTRSSVENSYIHTVAAENLHEGYELSFGLVKAGDPVELRCRILEELRRVYAEKHGLKKESVRFHKTADGLPALKIGNQGGTGHPCSISHHGTYGAYAMA